MREGGIVLNGDVPSEAETFMATVHGAMLSARAYGDPGVFHVIARNGMEKLTPPEATRRPAKSKANRLKERDQ